jgi:integrase/recombinase XerD
MAQAKTLTQNEIDQLLRYVARTRSAERNRLLVLFSFWSGMRVGEIASLEVGDVTTESGAVRNEIRLSATQTKGSYGRTVFINDKLQTEIASYLSRTTLAPSSPLFPTTKGRGFSANSLTQWFFWAYKKAGIAGASSHSGRRTFITTLASKGVGVRVLASLAGHRSISVTQRYIDCNDEMKREAVRLI